MRDLLRHLFGNTFFILFWLFLLSGSLAFFVLGKEPLFLYINGFGGTFANGFFFIATLLGEWAFIAFALIAVWLYRREQIINIALAFSLNGLVSFLLKNFVFTQAPRPATYFQEQLDLVYLSPFLKTVYWQSFPSGHTFTAFTGFAFLALLSKSWRVQALCFVLAFTAGISRIYNGMHFPEDVLAGALLGVLNSVIIYTFVPPVRSKKHSAT